MSDKLATLLSMLNYFGIFVAAMSGAAAGIKWKTDFFGMVVLAFATGCSGGIFRDILLGDAPPENIRAWQPLVITLIAGLFTYFLFPSIQWFLKNPVQILDAFSLGVFTVIGANKALMFQITPVWAILLGVVTGVGGGMARDLLLTRPFTILHKEIYATASLAGGACVVLGWYLPPVYYEYFVVLGALVCTTVRILAVRFKWNMPTNQVSQRIRREN